MRSDKIDEMQQKVIDARGVVRVDAGPGTGKTETIANRYLKLIESGVEPDDILLITFTRNGSKEMLQRLSSKLGPDNNLIDDLRISTFDALSNKIIQQSTESISRFFGIQALLFKDSKLVENESSNKTYFKRTLHRMRGADSSNPYFELLYTDWADLYYTIKKLMNFGIFPQQEGWFGFYAKNADGTSSLYGSSEKIEKNLSDLEKKVIEGELEKMEADSRYHLPRDLELDGTLNPRFFPQISGRRPDEPDDDYDSTMKDRDLQISFIHDVYLNYIRCSIEDNRLTFGLAAMFAFVVLYENKGVRQSFGSKYIMIDEFQDTNCNQLMTSLMLLKDPGNKQAQLCMVGDFRQSIFGFRDAEPEYFKGFSDLIGPFVDFLGDRVSVEITLSEENDIVLDQNYRSSQEIIDFSYAAFKSSTGEATKSVYDSEQPSKIEMVKVNGKEDHIGEVIARIRNYHNNEDYPIFRGFDVNGDRVSSSPDFGDIAVLCRSNKRAYQIAERLSDQGFPVFLNSDVELMNTREGKTILAWLRYLEDPGDKRSIGTILVEQGYHRESVLEILNDPTKKVPEMISGFREELSEKKDRPLKIVTAIANRFDYMDAEIVSAISDVLLTEYEDTGCTVSELIDFIEKNISDSGKFTIDKPMDSKSIVVETIHKAKGSEFPIVIIPFMYDNAFPASGSHKETAYSFSKSTGLRSAHELVKKGDEVYLQKSWKYRLASKAESRSKDEENRLLFVALSRSKQYITTIANAKNIGFHDRLFKSEYASAPLNRCDAKARYTQSSHYIPPQNFPTGSSCQWVSVHDVIDQTTDGYIDDSETESLGIEYGLELHRAAELLIQDPSFDCDELDLEEDDVEVLRDVIKNLTDNGFELESEVDCKLPFPDEHIVLHGIMDLFAIREENGHVEIQIHDWKTDNNTAVRRNGYEQQVSIYYCAVKKCYPDAEISCYLDYIRARPEDPVVKAEIRNTEEIDGLIKNYLGCE